MNEREQLEQAIQALKAQRAILGDAVVKAAPVPVPRLLATQSSSGKVQSIVGLESPLVGREAEFRALQEAIERIQSGVGGIVTLVGEAGLGKSRLVAEIRNSEFRIRIG